MDRGVNVDAGYYEARSAALRAASRSLAELLDTDPGADEALADTEALPDAAAYRAGALEAVEADGWAGLRRFKRHRLLGIAARDLAGEVNLERVGLAIADLADAVLAAGLSATGISTSVAVIAMGKLGGRELNYASDIDLMFVVEDDPQGATKAVERLVAELTAFGPEGQAYRVDLNLRPEGRSGPVVRSLDAYLEYYRRWAQRWEFQALIKARFCAGDESVGDRFIESTRPFVFVEQLSAEDVANIRKMKERVEQHAQRVARRGRSTEADDVKLGPGGIRDIEFSVQLLQLVHGGGDPAVRSGNTLEALGALTEGGYVADDDAAGLATAYTWLRTVEHRLQLWQERQVHHLPTDHESRSRVARVMGFRDSPAATALERFEDRHRAVLADVRSRFERLFYRPMIESLSDPATARLSREALRDRLAVLGFRDVDRAARTLDDLVSGVGRRAKLFRVLTPALLRHLTTTPLPDEGLFGFLKVGQSLETRSDVLGALRDNPPGLEALARILGSGRLLSDVLTHVPDEISVIAEERGVSEPKDADRLHREGVASLEWRDPARRLDGLRRFKRREMLRIAVADINASIDVGTVGESLADLADACLHAALNEEGVDRFAIIGMGKLGGRELSYSSDIDVMFIHDTTPEEAEHVAEHLMKAIGEVTPEGQAFRIDAALRPEGRSGPLARSLRSAQEYYEKWAQTWEYQALIKARVAAGSTEIGSEFLSMTHPLSYRGELAPAALAEIRHLKGRMERERVPRGVDPRRHLKMGPGTISDIEFSIQILQLQHGAKHEDLRVTNTLRALEQAARLELLEENSARWLADAYRFLARARNRLYFMFGKPVDVMPTKPEDLEALGVSLGYRDQPRQEVEEDYLRLTRRARKVAERLIYG
ncbi:MAG TPA: bifunctional [glutamine synthetase] adenylyltransferase/[glutamine synthetase]-adenylyl-L-tyrosine phosphorylase [Actinomycetota bacterium]|nr:bifunctional [glutamine synthetase] adenylyltransferase/[glutamine synthetase]-adenylyl-L-tyrosine phosphorylase [Actinomycetota bacterium]